MPTISDAILQNCRSTWLKVARVLRTTHEDLGLPDDDAAFNSIALELEKLVEAGTLEAAGELSKWRESEVRIAATK